ncbi:MAG: DUF3794 domain-containing protein [Ruminococcus sp.]|nr:DUF3794 domain-containing protein [Ruminococcus sp.]
MAATRFNAKKDTFVQCCSAVETQFEQSLEKDFILPDYCPDIFRILKCRAYPRVISQSVNGDKASMELEALIKVLYLSENSGRINVLEQKLSCTKTIDLPEDCRSPLIYACPRVDYLNCRVISPRRLDVRGAVTVRVNVVCERKKEFISDAEGAGIQLRKSEVSYISERMAASKRITMIEELDLGEAKPAPAAIISTDCAARAQEVKLVSGKAVCKGEIALSVEYIPNEESASGAAAEMMQFAVPFSQVLDLEGVDESCEISIDIVSAGCDIVSKSSDPRSLECEIVLIMNCTALRYKNADAVTDAFSTQYECECESGDFTIEGRREKSTEQLSLSGTLRYEDGNIASVCCCRCEAESFTVRDGTVSGTALVTLIGMNGDGGAIYLENELPFEFEPDEGCEVTAVETGTLTYQLTSDNSADIRAEVLLTVNRSSRSCPRPLTNITVSEEKLSDSRGSCALKLYRVGEGERLWDIAKKYKTSVKAIIEENELGAETAENGGMLLIPLTN